MINVEVLRQHQDNFGDDLKKYQELHSKLELLRLNFVTKFPIDSIMDIQVDDYILGKQNRDSFCYWIENKLDVLGRTGIGSPKKKYGVVYGTEKNDKEVKYRYDETFGNNLESAFNGVKAAISELLNYAKSDNTNKLIENKLYYITKAKILYLYFPLNYLNIFSNSHIDIFLRELDITFSLDEDAIVKRERLLGFKTQDDIMQSWSLYEYMRFLYKTYKPEGIDSPDSLVVEINNVSGNLVPIREELPTLEQVNPVLLRPSLRNTSQSPNRSPLREFPKVNFEDKHKQNIEIGKRGEKIILDKEKERLNQAYRLDLALKAKIVSEKRDDLGYDILSYETDGTPKYIEVKSTKALYRSGSSFFVSDNQLRVANIYKEKFYICLVFEVHTMEPEYYFIKDPFGDRDYPVVIQNNDKQISLEPKHYKATVEV